MNDGNKKNIDYHDQLKSQRVQESTRKKSLNSFKKQNCPNGWKLLVNF